MNPFRIESPFQPAGDQPAAIDALTRGVESGSRYQVLLGVTGSGKTFTIANLVERVQRPTLVLAPNKTLAAQLYREFKELFPGNAVEYFVSYYDYYLPEAYIPTTDTYIAKESSINDEIDRLRHSATRAILERRDTIVVASVSCIFGMGNPHVYGGMMLEFRVGDELDVDAVLLRLVEMQYTRESYDFYRGSFRLRGDTLELFPAWENSRVIRVGLFGDRIEGIEEVDPLTGRAFGELSRALVLPNSHYVTPPEVLSRAMDAIRVELKTRLEELHRLGKPHYAERLEQKTLYDLEMLEISGHCNGIENYSRFLDGRASGEAPWTLLDYFPEDFLMVVDESHVSIPQLGGMYRGDRARKQTLVDYGFRLPSALDNRPLTFDEWKQRVGQTILVSATPGDWDLQQTGGETVQQIARPTGLLDPSMEVRPATHQVEDVLGEVKKRVERGQRTLITTLTKRMAEDLTEYLREQGVEAAYLHSDIDTLERIDVINALRTGKHTCLVGINLLREGLDIPEVSLVAVLDADKEGFLRGERSLIQVSGRAARHQDGHVLLYADRITGSMARAMDESGRRRSIQEQFNTEHGIIPTSVTKPILEMPRGTKEPPRRGQVLRTGWKDEMLDEEIEALKSEMKRAASALDFEKAARIRDRIQELLALRLQQ